MRLAFLILIFVNRKRELWDTTETCFPSSNLSGWMIFFFFFLQVHAISRTPQTGLARITDDGTERFSGAPAVQFFMKIPKTYGFDGVSRRCKCRESDVYSVTKIPFPLCHDERRGTEDPRTLVCS